MPWIALFVACKEQQKHPMVVAMAHLFSLVFAAQFHGTILQLPSENCLSLLWLLGIKFIMVFEVILLFYCPRTQS